MKAQRDAKALGPLQEKRGWAQLKAQLSHHPAQRVAYQRLEALPIGMRFKTKHLLSDSIRPNARGAAVLAAKALSRRALRLGLIRQADGVHGLVPYYEKVR